MTDQTMTAEGQETTQEGSGEQEGTDTPAQPVEGSEQPLETFGRDYVEKLRAEAAANRVKGKQADELMVRLVRALASSDRDVQLVDVTDLPVSDLLPELLDDDGFPDPAKVHDALARLAASKPHLARPVFSGDVGQGVTAFAEQEPGLGSMLRDAAR